MLVINKTTKILEWNEFLVSLILNKFYFHSDYLYIYYHDDLKINIKSKLESHEDYLSISNEEINEDFCIVLHKKYIQNMNFTYTLSNFIFPSFWPNRKIVLNIKTEMKHFDALLQYIEGISNDTEIVLDCLFSIFNTQDDLNSFFAALYEKKIIELNVIKNTFMKFLACELGLNIANTFIQKSKTLKKVCLEIDSYKTDTLESILTNPNVKIWRFELKNYDPINRDITPFNPNLLILANINALVYLNNTLIKHGKHKCEYQIQG